MQTLTGRPGSCRDTNDATVPPSPLPGLQGPEPTRVPSGAFCSKPRYPLPLPADKEAKTRTQSQLCVPSTGRTWSTAQVMGELSLHNSPISPLTRNPVLYVKSTCLHAHTRVSRSPRLPLRALTQATHLFQPSPSLPNPPPHTPPTHTSRPPSFRATGDNRFTCQADPQGSVRADNEFT